MRLALKVDCDTFEGTKKGIPTLLHLFKEFKIRASFFFTLGPDTSGRAIFRVFTQRGFLKKMLRSNAASLYGPKTMLYGTLLPPPHIGKHLHTEIKSVYLAGHEVGVHGWDHIRWHDRLDRMTDQQISADYGRAHETFEEIFGFKAQASATPGWHATARFLAIQDRYEMLYASNTRGAAPFFPKAGNEIFKTLEIPTTLPTWDEALAAPEFQNEDELLSFYNRAIDGTHVHSIHTEVEGGVKSDLFRRQLQGWRDAGVEFVTLEKIAKETLQNRASIPNREISRVTIPHRGGLVTSSK